MSDFHSDPARCRTCAELAADTGALALHQGLEHDDAPAAAPAAPTQTFLSHHATSDGAWDEALLLGRRVTEARIADRYRIRVAPSRAHGQPKGYAVLLVDHRPGEEPPEGLREAITRQQAWDNAMGSAQ